ncbi:MAG: hypothetical protein ABSC46_10505 [Candidatus Limnocylindrales bacterium]
MDEPVVAKQHSRMGRTERVGAEGARDDAAVDKASAYDAATDQATADEARLRYRRRGVGRIDADERIGPILEPDEQLVAVRRSAVVYRPETPESGAALPGVVDVYVTTRRLVLVGQDVHSFDLATVDEAVISNERLLLVLCDGVGLVLKVDWPRLLRVEIAAARAARR